MNFTPLLMLVVLGLAFWLMVIRPAKTRQRAVQQIQGQLALGQRVMTTAGLFGYVRELSDDEVGLEIADGVVVRYVREAIAKVVEDNAGAADSADVPGTSERDEAAIDASRTQ